MAESLAELYERRTKILAALDKAREAISYSTQHRSVTRSYRQLLEEEKMVNDKIAALENQSRGGNVTYAQFERPS